MKTIGIIHTPFKTKEGMPIQPAGAEGIRGQIHIHEEFKEGLKDLDGFSHIILLCHLHKSEGYAIEVVPFLDTVKRGLFATRAPRRPNPIGLSVVKLLGIKDNILEIDGVDMLDGTPLLDIKPYVGDFERIEGYRGGWTEGKVKNLGSTRSDRRFSGK